MMLSSPFTAGECSATSKQSPNIGNTLYLIVGRLKSYFTIMKNEYKDLEKNLAKCGDLSKGVSVCPN